MFSCDPLASAMEIGAERKNPRWGEGKEDDAAEEDSNEEIRVFYPRQACFIYKYILMGLHKNKAQSASMGFYILPRVDDKEETSFQIRRYI
jgi:hypothetical protein